MTAAYFVDTNVLLDSVSTVSDEAAKRSTACEILRRRDLALSVQVLQEFYNNAMRRVPEPIPHDVAVEHLRAWMRFPVQDQTRQILFAALQTKVRYQISYWDAAVIEAAKMLGCHTLLTEDLNDGQDYGGVRVVNPFVHAVV